MIRQNCFAIGCPPTSLKQLLIFLRPFSIEFFVLDTPSSLSLHQPLLGKTQILAGTIKSPPRKRSNLRAGNFRWYNITAHNCISYTCANVPCFCFEVVLRTQYDEYQVFRRKVQVHIKNMIKFDINTTRNRNTSYGRLEKHLSVNNAMEIPNQKSSREPRHLATLFLLNFLLSFFFMMITVIYTQMFFIWYFQLEVAYNRRNYFMAMVHIL